MTKMKVLSGAMVAGALLMVGAPRLHAQMQQSTTTETTTTRTDGTMPPPPPPPMQMEAPQPGYADFGYAPDNMAARNGYNAGFGKGISDARSGHSYRPQEDHLYNHPTGYQGGPVSKGEYDRIYKEAFLHGYERGFRGSAR